MRPIAFDPGTGGLLLLILAALFLPALCIFMLRASIPAIRNGEVRYRGTLYSKSESRFWYWLVMVLIMFATAFVGLSALVFMAVLLFKIRLPVFG